jgi:hypothetical protein
MVTIRRCEPADVPDVLALFGTCRRPGRIFMIRRPQCKGDSDQDRPNRLGDS